MTGKKTTNTVGRSSHSLRTLGFLQGLSFEKVLFFQENYLRTFFFQCPEKSYEEPDIDTYIWKYDIISPPGHAQN